MLNFTFCIGNIRINKWNIIIETAFMIMGATLQLVLINLFAAGEGQRLHIGLLCEVQSKTRDRYFVIAWRLASY